MGYRRTTSESSSLISGCIRSSTHSTSPAAAILKIVLERRRLGSIFLRRSDWFFVMSLVDGLPSLETRRIQDMLLIINNSISDKAPPAIRDLITLRSSKYNLRHDYILSLPKVSTSKYGLKSWRYFAAKKWNKLANDIIRIKACLSID